MLTPTLLAWTLILTAGTGMVVGLAKPPRQYADKWLAALCLAGIVGFLLIPNGIALAFFTGLGTWLGTLITARRGDRNHFRAGAVGWLVGLGAALWWILLRDPVPH